MNVGSLTKYNYKYKYKMSFFTMIIDFLYYKKFNLAAEIEITHNNSIFKLDCSYEKEEHEDIKFFGYGFDQYGNQHHTPAHNQGNEQLFYIKTETKPKNISWETHP